MIANQFCTILAASGRENYALFVAITWVNGQSNKPNLESKNSVEVQFKWNAKNTTKASGFFKGLLSDAKLTSMSAAAIPISNSRHAACLPLLHFHKRKIIPKRSQGTPSEQSGRQGIDGQVAQLHLLRQITLSFFHQWCREEGSFADFPSENAMII